MTDNSPPKREMRDVYQSSNQNNCSSKIYLHNVSGLIHVSVRGDNRLYYTLCRHSKVVVHIYEEGHTVVFSDNITASVHV